MSDDRGSSDGRRILDTGPIDVSSTVRTLGLYPGDPTVRWSGPSFTKAVLTPEGPGTVALSWANGGQVVADAWGPGAAWLLDRSTAWVGLHDDVSGFDPTLHPKVQEWWRRFGGLRQARSGVVWQELALVLLGQRVTTREAVLSWSQICRRWGEHAPGPTDVLMPPRADRLAEATYRDLHPMGVERRRAEVLLLAARRANRIEEAAAMPVEEAYRRLTAFQGIGVWSATSTLTVSHGDPDVIVLGDFGIPTMVNYAFTGDAVRLPPDEGGDERMEEHLAPWAGHRQRIIRLLFTADVTVPRRHPKSANPDIRRL